MKTSERLSQEDRLFLLCNKALRDGPPEYVAEMQAILRMAVKSHHHSFTEDERELLFSMLIRIGEIIRIEKCPWF